jgi:hypothetical protein
MELKKLMTKEIEKMKYQTLKHLLFFLKMMLFCIVFNFGLFLLNFIEITKLNFFYEIKYPSNA